MVNVCAQIYLQNPQDVEAKHYRIILTSPEMCLGNSGFAALLKEPRWSRSILFNGSGRSSLYQTVGCGVSKAVLILGDASFVRAPRGAGSGDLSDNASRDIQTRSIRAQNYCRKIVPFKPLQGPP